MDLVDALRAGLPVLLPTDTVYGLVGAPAKKRRDPLRAEGTRAHAAHGDSRGDRRRAARTRFPSSTPGCSRGCCPGRTRIVVANPAGRFPWLTGGRTGPIGVRVPQLPTQTHEIVVALGIVLATSANDPGGPNPVTLDDVPRRIRDGCGAELDLGPLPGTPSTVIDLTHDEPRILREGAVPATEALRRLRA